MYSNIIITIVLVLVLYIILEKKLHNIKITKKIKEEREFTTTMQEKKLKDDIDLERDRDLGLIKDYMKDVKDILDRYNNSRSKKIAYTTRQRLLYITITMIPIFNKYIVIDFYYDPDDSYLKNMSDKDLMKMLESSYNDFTQENLEGFNNILSIVLKLRDNNGSK